MKIPLKIFFLRYTNIFNTTVGVDFFTTDSEIEMFCYLFLPWPKNMILFYWYLDLFYLALARGILKKVYGWFFN